MLTTLICSVYRLKERISLHSNTPYFPLIIADLKLSFITRTRTHITPIPKIYHAHNCGGIHCIRIAKNISNVCTVHVQLAKSAIEIRVRMQSTTATTTRKNAAVRHRRQLKSGHRTTNRNQCNLHAAAAGRLTTNLFMPKYSPTQQTNQRMNE